MRGVSSISLYNRITQVALFLLSVVKKHGVNSTNQIIYPSLSLVAIVCHVGDIAPLRINTLVPTIKIKKNHNHQFL